MQAAIPRSDGNPFQEGCPPDTRREKPRSEDAGTRVYAMRTQVKKKKATKARPAPCPRCKERRTLDQVRCCTQCDQSCCVCCTNVVQDFILPLKFLCTECRPVAQWTPGLRPTTRAELGDDEVLDLVSKQQWEPVPLGPDQGPDVLPPVRLTAREKWGSTDHAATAARKESRGDAEALERIVEETWHADEDAEYEPGIASTTSTEGTTHLPRCRKGRRAKGDPLGKIAEEARHAEPASQDEEGSIDRKIAYATARLQHYEDILASTSGSSTKDQTAPLDVQAMAEITNDICRRLGDLVDEADRKENQARTWPAHRPTEVGADAREHRRLHYENQPWMLSGSEPDDPPVDEGDVLEAAMH